MDNSKEQDDLARLVDQIPQFASISYDRALEKEQWTYSVCIRNRDGDVAYRNEVALKRSDILAEDGLKRKLQAVEGVHRDTRVFLEQYMAADKDDAPFGSS